MSKKAENKRKSWNDFIKAHSLEGFDFYIEGSQIGIKMSYRPTLFVYSKGSSAHHWGNEIKQLATLIKYVRGAQSNLVDIRAEFIDDKYKISWEQFRERVLLERLSGIR